MILAKAKSEKGSAFILALMVVAAVGLLVVPVIYLATTGLRSTNLAQQRFLERYAADAGVEEGIWLAQDNPPSPGSSVKFSSTFNDLPTEIEVEQVLRAAMPTPILSSNLSGGNMAIHKTVDPQYVAPCLNPCPSPVLFTYTIFIENFGNTEIKLDEIGDCLPKGFTFVQVIRVKNIFEVPSPQDEFDVAKIEPHQKGPLWNDPAAPWPCGGDRWQVKWDFGSAPPEIRSNTMAEIEFEAIGLISGLAEHPNDAWIEVKSNSFPVPIALDKPVPVFVECPMSEVSSTAGGTTVEARITVCQNGIANPESYILSWQVE